MPARDYYLKDKTLETLCQREQRPTHAHRCAGLACGARSAPGGWLREARRWVCCGLRRTGGSSSGCRFGFGAFSSSPYTTPLCWVWGPGMVVLWSCQKEKVYYRIYYVGYV